MKRAWRRKRSDEKIGLILLQPCVSAYMSQSEYYQTDQNEGLLVEESEYKGGVDAVPQVFRDDTIVNEYSDTRGDMTGSSTLPSCIYCSWAWCVDDNGDVKGVVWAYAACIAVVIFAGIIACCMCDSKSRKKKLQAKRARAIMDSISIIKNAKSKPKGAAKSKSKGGAKSIGDDQSKPIGDDQSKPIGAN